MYSRVSLLSGIYPLPALHSLLVTIKIKLNSHLIIIPSTKEDWNECQPDDAGAVHGKPDVLGLVEVLRDLPGLESVPGAQEDEDHVEDQGQNQRHGGDAASLNCYHHTWVDYLVINK